MSSLGFNVHLDLGLQHYWPLALMLLALLPLLARGYRAFDYPALSRLPYDAWSLWLQRLWRLCGVLALLALALALSGPYSNGQRIAHVGQGAHVMVVLDRSASMNDDFADKQVQGNAPDGISDSSLAGISKMAAARQVLRAFVAQSREDLIGMVTFSTSPILVAPLGGDRAAVLAALDATEAGGMGFTAIARGLGMGLDYFSKTVPGFSKTAPDLSKTASNNTNGYHTDSQLPLTGARAVLLVSDGAAHLDVQTQDSLRLMFQKQQAALYWIYLRSKSGPHLEEKPQEGNEQSYPEYELHRYFQSLGVSYRAYEADNPQAVQTAMADIARLNKQTVLYYEAAGRRDLSGPCYFIALLCTLVLFFLQLTEVKVWRSE